ncbi:MULTISPECIES: DUF7838 family putative zinc beta-ribbon protein [unclassified Haladaptatus]|uniref:DUF7838 family putative zinc beta-ribbon protein n=1 Tax=unclassified Haladaptatus TaxID=2622732 RepID=UPI002FCDF9FE
MSLELEHDCPHCGETRVFYKAASMTVHLGTKTKWRCPECNYAFIKINGIDSSVSA